MWGETEVRLTGNPGPTIPPYHYGTMVQWYIQMVRKARKGFNLTIKSEAFTTVIMCYVILHMLCLIYIYEGDLYPTSSGLASPDPPLDPLYLYISSKGVAPRSSAIFTEI